MVPAYLSRQGLVGLLHSSQNLRSFPLLSGHGYLLTARRPQLELSFLSLSHQKGPSKDRKKRKIKIRRLRKQNQNVY